MSKNLLNLFVLGCVVLVFGELKAQEPAVSRSIMTTGIDEREPVDEIDSVSVDAGKVYFFTELKNLEGNTITHRWILDGEVIAEVPFDVKGPRWRVHSRKNLTAEFVGDWTVEVVDSSNNVLDEAAFVCTAGAKSISPVETDLSESVKRAIFTTNVVDREPVDEVDTLSTNNDKIFFFTELSGLSGRQVEHRWIHAGDVKAEKSFDVGADRWRVYSSKNLIPGWSGTWQVEVVVDDSTIVGTHGFVYQ